MYPASVVHSFPRAGVRMLLVLVSCLLLAACGAGGSSLDVLGEPPPTESTFHATGPVGGPFRGSGPVDLVQAAPEEFAYAIACNVPWIGWEVPTSGTVPAGGDLVAALSIDAATAPAAVGTFTGTLTLTNSQTQAVRGLVDITLEITEFPVQYFGFQASGPSGGPFSGAPASFEFENESAEAYDYQLSSNRAWVNWSVPTTGTVSGSGSLVLSLTIDAALAPTAAGTYAAVVTLADTTSQATRGTIDVTLLVDDDGWTDPEPSADSRIVYVSNSLGNDANNGLSESAPVRTFTRAKALIRSGYPDWMLLKRGDTWSTPIGEWNRSGRSATEPCVIWAYGSGSRPIIAPTAGPGWYVINDPRHHVYVMGLEFIGTRDGSVGLSVAVADGTSDILFEDLCVHGWTNGMVPQGVNDLRVRRCVLYENGTPNGHGQGFYTSRSNGVLVEDCVFDMNGWVEGSFAATIFDHNMYFTDANQNCVLRGNIIARASSHGAHFRSGGLVEGNLFLRNPINLQVGYAQDPSANSKPNGVVGTVRGNVILGAGDIADQPRGFAILLQNMSSGTVEDNIFAHGTGSQRSTLQINSQFGIGVHDVTIEDNIWYRWGEGTWLEDDNVSGITLQGNAFQEPSGTDLWRVWDSSLAGSAFTSSSNSFYSTTTNPYRVPTRVSFAGWQSWIGDSTSSETLVEYPDPELTIGDYDDSIGGAGTLVSFLTEARKQSRQNWRGAYTAEAAVTYFREAFGR